MGEWGGLPQKYNGVSDACILVDKNTGDIYVAGLWMHGLLDKDGKWIEGLNEVARSGHTSGKKRLPTRNRTKRNLSVYDSEKYG